MSFMLRVPLLVLLAVPFVADCGEQSTVAGGMQPFTETIEQMKAHDAGRAAATAPRPRRREAFTAQPSTQPERPFTPPAPPQAARNREASRAPQTVSAASFTALNYQDEIVDLGQQPFPPDTMGAIGPNHFVEIINNEVAFYTRTGAKLSFLSLDAFFFTVLGGTNYPRGTAPSAFDPRVQFDRRSGHWFACTLENGLGAGEFNHIILAVSRTADPTGTWDKYVIQVGEPTVGPNTFFTDFDTMGVDDNGVYFGVTIFPSSPAPTFKKIAATAKASLVSATPSLGQVFITTNITDMRSSPQPATNLDAVAATGTAWIVSSSPTGAAVNFKTLTWNGATPTVSATGTLPSAAYAQPPTAPASGSTVNLDNGDDRILCAAIRNKQLWTTRNIGVNSQGTSAGADRTGCEWFHLDVSGGTPSIVQTGRVFDSTATTRFYYYGTIMVNGQGHAALAFSGSAANEFVGVYTCGRLASDPLGTMQAITLVKAGNASYQKVASGLNRWGDYSYTSLDPNDDMTIWTIQEHAPFLNIWGTYVAKLIAPPPTMNNPAANAPQGQPGTTVNLTGTGFYDPGAGFTNRLAVAVSGNGIANYNVKFNNSTSVTVTFDISPTAATGPRNITLTNPDGQAVTVTGGLSIATAVNNFLVESAAGGNIPDQVAGVPFNIKLTARDFTNTPLTTFTGTADISSNGFLSAGGGTSAAFAAGVLPSSSVTITSSGNFAITATLTKGTAAGTSNSFNVVNPIPILTSLDPKSAVVGGPSFTLTLNGSGFVPSSVVKWAGQPDLTPVTQTSTKITVLVPASYITAISSSAITVFNPAPAGGTSTPQTFAVTFPPPVITSALTAMGTIGLPFTYTITATGAGPITLGATNLPAGLTFSGATISGAPTAGGPFNITLTAANSGGTTSATLVLTVGPPIPPSITSPATATATQGQPFAYKITASGSPVITFTAASLPDGLSLAGDTISGVPTQSGLTQFTIIATSPAGTDSKPVILTIAQAAGAPPPAPPTFSSPPVPPAPPVAGQPVTLTAGGSSSGSQLVLVIWDFGDGTSGVGSTVTHVYTVPGIYTVTATLSDGVNTVTQSFVVAVNAVLPDLSGGTGPLPNAFSVFKGSLKFNFVNNKDSLTLSGTVPLPQFFTPSGKTITLVAGGLRIDSQLNEKGKSSDRTFSMTGKAKQGVFTATPAKFTFTQKGPLFAKFQQYGFVSTDLKKPGTNITVPVLISIDGTSYIDTPSFNYTAKANKTGSGTAKK